MKINKGTDISLETNESSEAVAANESASRETELGTQAVDLSQADLQKSLDKLEALASANDKTTRKETLLNKALTADLSEEERTELFQLTGKPSQEKDTTLAKEVVKGMEENSDLQKAMDVSPFLQANQSELIKSLEGLATHIEDSDARQQEFFIVLAKAVADIGRNVLDMNGRLGTIENLPNRQPKSKGVPAQPLNKSFAGQPSQGKQLSKSEVMGSLMELLEDSMSKGLDGNLADGTNLVAAISKYEQFNQLQPSLVQRVQNHIRTRGATAH